MLTNHTSKVVFHGNGVTTQFPFIFKVWTAAQLLLEVVDAQGVQQTLSPWTVSLSENGGTLHYTHEGSPLPPGYTLAILRNMPFTQEVNLISGTRFDPAVIEAQLDKATAERQQLREMVERSVQVPPTASYTGNDILQEIYQAQSDSSVHAAAAAQSEAQAQASADTAENFQEQSRKEMEKAQSEANRAKAEADRAAAEANVVVDGVSIEKNAHNTLTTKTYSLQDFSYAPTEEEQKYPASVGALSQIMTLPIGTQIAVRCSASYVPEGCIPEDGTEYSKAYFPDLWENYLITGLLHTCTYTEAQAQIDATGACNAFALDLERETFKAPYTPSGYMTQQAMDDVTLGTAHKAGIPNIQGGLSRVLVVDGNTASGAFNIGEIAPHNLDAGGGTLENKVDITFDASRISNVYGASSTVQPHAIALRHFVVVATGSINQSQMDWSAWAGGLAGKVNTADVGYACIINGGSTGTTQEVQDASLGNKGVVAVNSRYVLRNPFGMNTPVLCVAEILINGTWASSGWLYSSGGYGTQANYVQGEGIVIQTGAIKVSWNAHGAGGGHTGEAEVTSAPCRVHVWKVKGV